MSTGFRAECLGFRAQCLGCVSHDPILPSYYGIVPLGVFRTMALGLEYPEPPE